MSILDKKPELISDVIKISQSAGKIVLSIYNQPQIESQLKSDKSPLTEADKKSNDYIIQELKRITPDTPVVSEEVKNVSFSTRSKWTEYWLVDPLDGTKEFIKKNDEFTVNIALIENNKPVFGVIDIPVMEKTFWGARGFGSYVIKENRIKKKIFVSKYASDELRILTSRSHLSDEVRKITKEFRKTHIIEKGSSIKLCLIAAGHADIYPRHGPTSEWDIAAGHAIVKYAGGSVLTRDGHELKYNFKENFTNKSFVALGDQKLKDNLSLYF